MRFLKLKDGWLQLLEAIRIKGGSDVFEFERWGRVMLQIKFYAAINDYLICGDK